MGRDIIAVYEKTPICKFSSTCNILGPRVSHEGGDTQLIQFDFFFWWNFLSVYTQYARKDIPVDIHIDRLGSQWTTVTIHTGPELISYFVVMFWIITFNHSRWKR